MRTVSFPVAAIRDRERKGQGVTGSLWRASLSTDKSRAGPSKVPEGPSDDPSGIVGQANMRIPRYNRGLQKEDEGVYRVQLAGSLRNAVGSTPQQAASIGPAEGEP